MNIAIDFDGTIVKHDYPRIGDPVPGAIEWMLKFQQFLTVNLFLWTMRSDKELREAVMYCVQSGINFAGVNQNPGQLTWTKSPKLYAHIYIDDAALGCPLIKGDHSRPYVNWEIVGPMVMEILH